MTLTTTNIETLIQLCVQQNQNAQLEVYNRYYKAMYNTAYRIVNNAFEAEDIMQECFLTAFEKLHTLNDIKTFSAWLKRIVINRSLQHYKLQNKYNEVPIDNTLYKIADETDNDFSENINLKAQEVLQLMDTLKDNYKHALNLFYIEGYDYHEMADIMAISYANARTLLSRAKESLRQRISDYEFKKNLMKKETDHIESLFKQLSADFDLEAPNENHQARFLEKLNSNKTSNNSKNKLLYLWRPLVGIAAALVLFIAIITNITATPKLEGLATVSPEMEKTHNFYTAAISQELIALKNVSQPETKLIVDDALAQLKVLETDYNKLKHDLKISGDDKRVIYAMITNFQNRITVLQNALEQIESIKKLNITPHEKNNTL